MPAFKDYTMIQLPLSFEDFTPKNHLMTLSFYRFLNISYTYIYIFSK